MRTLVALFRDRLTATITAAGPDDLDLAHAATKSGPRFRLQLDRGDVAGAQIAPPFDAGSRITALAVTTPSVVASP